MLALHSESQAPQPASVRRQLAELLVGAARFQTVEGGRVWRVAYDVHLRDCEVGNPRKARGDGSTLRAKMCRENLRNGVS